MFNLVYFLQQLYLVQPLGKLRIAYGVDVAKHLVHCLRSVSDPLLCLFTYALAQGYYLVVLLYLFTQACYRSALKLSLKTGVEQKASRSDCTVCRSASSFFLSLAQVYNEPKFHDSVRPTL